MSRKNRKPTAQSDGSNASEQNKTKVSPGLPPTLHEPSDLEPGVSREGLVRMNEFWSYDPSTHSIGLTSMLDGRDLAKQRTAFLSSVEAINAEGWTVIIDYFATGEGRHVWYQRSHASSEALAIEQFRQKFFADDTDEAWAFWRVGLEVHRGAYWPGYLQGYVVPPNELEMHWESLL